MIIVSGRPFSISELIDEYSPNSIERQVLETMSGSTGEYRYDSLGLLKFELDLRREIVNAAKALNDSGMSFAVFQNSVCNIEYWDRTDNGGFMLKEGAKPEDAINDIFENGGKYATECATAIMIVYYKALLILFGEEIFNRVFSKIYLMDWDIREPLLKEAGTTKKAEDMLLGDRGYFENPDVDPATPEWQGENVIVLPGKVYYGHGIGIKTADEIIEALNATRKKDAKRSAYFLNSAGRPDFKKLYRAYNGLAAQTADLVWRPFPDAHFRNLNKIK